MCVCVCVCVWVLVCLISLLCLATRGPLVDAGVAYSLNGKRLPPGLMPSVLEDLAQVKVEYESFPGWKCDISKARTYEELPVNAQKYLQRVEQLVKVPISWVGVGAGRLDMATNGFRV
jgi:adenylosuccinate synthase